MLAQSRHRLQRFDTVDRLRTAQPGKGESGQSEQSQCDFFHALSIDARSGDDRWYSIQDSLYDSRMTRYGHNLGYIDELYRRFDMKENSGSTLIASWKYFGPSRVAEMKTGANSGSDDLYCTYLNNARTRSAVQSGESSPSWGDDDSDRLGFDGASRMITKRW